MKVNLNNHILDVQTYLQYLFENRQLKHQDYEVFCLRNPQAIYRGLIELAESKEIDIYPYLYTLEVIKPAELKAFERFHLNVLKRLEEPVYVETGQDFIQVISQSIEQIMIFIVSVQYFFL